MDLPQPQLAIGDSQFSGSPYRPGLLPSRFEFWRWPSVFQRPHDADARKGDHADEAFLQMRVEAFALGLISTAVQLCLQRLILDRALFTGKPVEPFFKGAAELLQFGPLGLAALMLVLAALALLLRNIDDKRESVLKRCISVSAFCFVVALIPQYLSAAHLMHIRIEPTSMSKMESLPQPVETVNNKPIEAPYSYWVYSETTTIIDVSDAFG